MRVTLKKASAENLKLQTLVVFATKPSGKKPTRLKGVDAEVSDLVLDAMEENSFQGGRNETLFFRFADVAGVDHLVVVGLGSTQELSLEGLREAAGALTSRLKSEKVSSVGVLLDSLPKVGRQLADSVQALTEGFILADYEYDDYKQKEQDKKTPEWSEVTLLVGSKSNPNTLKKGLQAGQVIGESTNFSRWLGDTPGNLMPPKTLAAETIKAAKGSGLKVTVWDKARIKKEKMGGLYGVSLGSSQEPRFIIMEYKGAAASKKPICFVGKGLTFDSGGISIKPSQSMDEMKYDMCGGAAVIGTMLAIARLKLKVNAIGLVPSSENMPGAAANKPGDILIARNGKSIEVLNTDAEGRLILADALCYASEKKPASIVDAATLTGAMVVALGNSHTGFFTRDKNFVKKIEAAADASGESVWHMPLTDAHVEDMKGAHADLSNVSSFRGAGSSTAAAFLEQFVDDGIPWAHFDVAGTAWNCSNRLTYVPKKGATGVMVRTFVELAKK